jgi:hypothetical protein
MTSEALFGLSVLLCFVAFGIVAGVYIWPWLVRTPRDDGFMALTIPHTFRFVGLSFLVPGVVSPTLARGFAVPAAYGDLVATVLALASIGALRLRSVLAIPLLWALNTWGHPRSPLRDLSGRDRRRSRPGFAGRGLLHSDARGPAAADHAWADVLAAVAARARGG